ncbi:hypothetical protein SEA_MINIFLAYER_13 [Satellite phage MiniFlayer]|nr:hypothetical protein SEA_MINIFLAYER_13 [Satellite phage MiniFlayer]
MNHYKKDKWLEAIDVHVALKTTVAYKNAAGKVTEKAFTGTFGYLAYFVANKYADWNTGEGVFVAKSTFAALVGMSRTSIIIPFFQVMEELGLMVKDDSKKQSDSDYYDLRMPRLSPDRTDIDARVNATKEAVAQKKKAYRDRLSSDETVSVLSQDSVCPPREQCLSSERTLTTNITSKVPTNTSTNKAVADAPPLNSRDNETQGEDVEIVSNVVDSVDSSLVIDSSSSASSLEVDVNQSVLVVEEVTAAPAAWDTNLSWETEKETRPAQEEEWKDMSDEEFGKWFEGASDAEKDVAAFAFEHRKYDSYEKIVKSAQESLKAQYDEWGDNVSLRYNYASMNVEAPSRNRTKELAPQASSTSNNILDEEW